MSLREVSCGSASDADACDGDCGRANVGEGDDLGGAGGAHGDRAEVQGRGREFGCGAYSREWYELRAAGGTIGHAERRAARSDRRRRERNAESEFCTTLRAVAARQAFETVGSSTVPSENTNLTGIRKL